MKKIVMILLGVVLLLAGVAVAFLYSTTPRRLDRAMKPFVNIRLDLMRAHEKALNESHYSRANYIHWLSSQIAEQSVVAGRATLNPDDPSRVTPDQRNEIVGAVVRFHNRANTMYDESPSDMSWQAGNVWEDVRNARGTKSPSDWDKVNAELKEHLSQESYESLIAAQEKYTIREYFCGAR